MMLRPALFWIPWSVAFIVALAVVFFFIWGVADGSVSSFNIALWIGLLAVTFAVTGGSLWLKSSGRPGLGALLSLVLAIPGAFAALFLLFVIVAKPRWN